MTLEEKRTELMEILTEKKIDPRKRKQFEEELNTLNLILGPIKTNDDREGTNDIGAGNSLETV